MRVIWMLKGSGDWTWKMLTWLPNVYAKFEFLKTSSCSCDRGIFEDQKVVSSKRSEVRTSKAE